MSSRPEGSKTRPAPGDPLFGLCPRCDIPIGLAPQRTSATLIAMAALIRLSRRWRIGGSVYLAAVAAVAVAAAVTHATVYFIAAVVLALPFGLAALVGVYGGYGLLTTVANAAGAHRSTDGFGPLWFVTIDGAVDVALFVAAGVGNVLVAHDLVARVLNARHDPHAGP